VRYLSATILLCSLVACAPTATMETSPDGCKASLNRGWFTEQEIRGYKASCDVAGNGTLEVDAQSQRMQAEALEALARGAMEGAAKGVSPVP
jgi:hypothetical protein